MNSNEPLAFRMRPKTLEEYVGQEHVIRKRQNFISNNKSRSIIKYHFIWTTRMWKDLISKGY